MIPEIKQEWVAALRSGKYKQGVGQMFAGGTEYCPLGVLCTIFAKYHKGKTRWAKVTNGTYRFECDNGLGKWMDGGTKVLPSVVVKWAQLDSSDPMFELKKDDGYTPSISELNDEGDTFQQIADRIEYGVQI
jgi:hypothetical protein